MMQRFDPLEVPRVGRCLGEASAGTGKTFLAVAAAVRGLKDALYERIILCRPAVEAGEPLGFLPGDLNQKIDPYLRYKSISVHWLNYPSSHLFTLKG